MPDDEPLPASLAEVGCYAQLSDARDRGLVVAAMGLPYWIIIKDRQYALGVEAADQEQVRAALREFEAEQSNAGPVEVMTKPLRIPVFALCLAVLVMVWFYWLQITAPASWVEQGIASSQAIMNGEWWRIFTALTIHGGSEHLLANLGIGTFFLAVAMAQLGGGAGALGWVLSVALGNLLNAWFYRNETHFSLGASTGVFGAMGLIVGVEVWARIRQGGLRTRGQFTIPLGVGLALLALFGTGEKSTQVDFMAHFWGLAAGVIIGVIFCLARLTAGSARWLQYATGLSAAGLLLLGWSQALSSCR